MNSGPLLFRADANVAIGTGHVMRCLALAQAWQDAGGSAIFAMAESTLAVRERLLAEGVDIVSLVGSAEANRDPGQLVSLAEEQAAEWVVVDGYQFETGYQSKLKSAGLRVLVVDDNGHAGKYAADIVLDQNISAGEGLYANREPHTRLLLGPRYCMLRREFKEWRNWKREVAAVGRKVLITMGGSDPDNATARVMQSLASVEIENLEAKVVVGGSNPHFESLAAHAQKSAQRITMVGNVSGMGELMAWADVAVSAAGTTCWELCFLGLPAILVDVAKNQTLVAHELDRRGCAIHLGTFPEVAEQTIGKQLQALLNSAENRRSISQLARDLVDGNGARRVVAALRGNELHLRPARESDGHLLWLWANDKDVRAASFSSMPIPWESHTAWFAEKLRESRIFVAQGSDEVPVGQIRFDLKAEGESEVHLSIVPEWRGCGLSARLIDLGVKAVFSENGQRRVHAFVKPNNMASMRAFEKTGFTRTEVERVKGFTAVHYIRERVEGKGF
jgi:UDP-2,4-diacetamido-2,4,6-trideoxy-beta-L-altropyranose hydrolase